MKIRKLLGLAIALVALAVAINALAFKTAAVTNTATIDVTATANAAVGIAVADTPGTGFSLNGSTTTSYAQIEFQDAMQPNSTYTYTGVFKIINNSGRSITINAATFEDLPTDVTVSLTKNALDGGGAITGPLGVGSDFDVDVTIQVGTNASVASNQSFKIVINAQE